MASYPHTSPPPLPPKPSQRTPSHPHPHVYIPQSAPPPPPPRLPSDPHLRRTPSSGWMSYVDAANAQLGPDGSYVEDAGYDRGYNDYNYDDGGYGVNGNGYGNGHGDGYAPGGTMSMPTPHAAAGPSFARAYSSDEYNYDYDYAPGSGTPTRRRTPSNSAYDTAHPDSNGGRAQAQNGFAGAAGQDYYLHNRNYDDYDSAVEYDHEPEPERPGAGYRYTNDYNNDYTNNDYDSLRRSQSSSSAYPAPVLPGAATSAFDLASGSLRFPEPEMHRSASASASESLRAHTPNPSAPRREQHRHTNSDTRLAREESFHSTYSLSRNSSHSSYAPSMDRAFSQESTDELTSELSQLTLESEEGLRRFQAGELPPADEEWHKLVPESAREAFGDREVHRQSILFEIFKSERDYVADLQAVTEVFIKPLRSANMINGGNTEEFIEYVFGNVDEILSFHQRMLGPLFARQREQHPIVQSIADIILETTLQFQPAYESYIKHYPLSEARHRTELKRNPAYRDFLQSVNHDARVRKRDLVTFLSRPVTRLPRLALLLETLLKHTDAEHPDQDSVKLIMVVLSDFLKSTQPGIEAAESKVKFFGVMENLVYRKGEIIDLDEQDESRSLVLSQTLARRQRSEFDWSGWNDYFVVLLDHYLLITKEWKRPSGSRYEVASRPIPLEYLRLGQFDGPSESRREKPDEGGGILDNLRFQTRPQYPFTVYHAADKLVRRYTLFTNTEAARKKWQDALKEAMMIHSVRGDANKWFAPNTINDGVFRVRSMAVPQSSTEQFTGDITAADTFVSQGRGYVVVGCTGGVYAGARGESTLRRVLTHQSANYIAALPSHNKVLIHADGSLLSYSMDLLARTSQGNSPPAALDASMEKVSRGDTVTIARAGVVKDRTVVIYSSKSLLQTTIHALEVLKEPASVTTSRFRSGKTTSYKSFGEPFYVPRAATEITPLAKTIGVASDKGITLIDPTNLRNTSVLVIPDFTDAPSDERISALKARCDNAKPLGLARVDRNESMVVYEDFGCYVDRHGKPLRKAAVVRWEARAVRFAERGAHVLLFSAGFVEVRHKHTSRLVQVLEGVDMKLLNAGLVPVGGTAPPEGRGAAGSGADEVDTSDTVPLLVSRLGKKNDKHGRSIELFELVKTAEIQSPGVGPRPGLGDEYWGEWDTPNPHGR